MTNCNKDPHSCDASLPNISRVGRGPKGEDGTSAHIEMTSNDNDKTVVTVQNDGEQAVTSKNINGGVLTYRCIKENTITEPDKKYFAIEFNYSKPSSGPDDPDDSWSLKTPLIPCNDNKSIVETKAISLFTRDGNDMVSGSPDWKEFLEYGGGGYSHPDPGAQWTINLNYGLLASEASNSYRVNIASIKDIIALTGMTKVELKTWAQGQKQTVGGDTISSPASSKTKDSGSYPTRTNIKSMEHYIEEVDDDLYTAESKISGEATSDNKVLSSSEINTLLDNQTHSASDITSGILPIARGGTGGATSSTARTNLEISNVENIELIWENASTSSSFPPQTINLDLSKYNKILVMSFAHKTQQLVTPITIVPIGKGGRIIDCKGLDHVHIYGEARSFHVYTNKVIFDEAYNVISEKDDTTLIPYRIYGIKEF